MDFPRNRDIILEMLKDGASMNIYDIAKIAGVSIATVSRVVNGGSNVSERTRRRVLAVIEEQGYMPNVFAQGLGLDSMQTIGILVPDISDAYMASCVSFLEKRLHGHGYGCILGCSGFGQQEKESHVQMLLSKRIDALMMIGSAYSDTGSHILETDYIRRAAEWTPVFILNGMVEGNNIYCGVNDDRQAVYDVTTALIRKGRRRILFLADSHSYSAGQKLAGYEQALAEAGIPVLGELKFYAKNRIHYVRDMLLEYKNLSFDSVVATDDGLAAGAVKYAGVKGLSIPQDLNVIGYNNSVLSICCDPELSSIDNKAEQLCHDMVERMIKVLQGNTDVERCSRIACELVKRCTTDF